MTLKKFIILICLFSISACGFSEKDARVLLNQAITEWDAGKIEKSLALFDRISNEYIDTETATEALKEKAQRLEKYLQEYNPENNLAQNKGILSKLIILSIDEYYKKHNLYPDTLSAIKISLKKTEKYFSMCLYSKAIMNYGYKLDCTEADISYLADREKAEKEANESRQRNSLLLKQRNQEHKTKIFLIEDFPKANITWGEKLNPQGKLSAHGFLAFYINTNQPSTIIKSEAVRDISINYGRDDFHGIKSQDFGAYWVGDIYFEEDAIKKITTSQSWSKARLIIDGHIIYEGGSDKELLLNFKAGQHHIEVEYINNWHTTEFALNILDSVESLSIPEIKKRLSSNILVDYSTYYAGLYESSSRDLSVTLDIAKTSKPVVLILGSYSSIKWNISNPFEVDIRAIVYGSHKPGSTIVGNIDNTLLLPSKNSIGSYDIVPRCSCHASNFHCEGGGNLRSTKMGIESFTNSKLTGFSGKYSAKSLQVPEVKITDRYLVELEEKLQNIQKQRESCRKTRNPDFENM